MRRVLSCGLWCGLGLVVASVAAAQNESPEIRMLEGHWEVVELAEDGHVIPRDQIPEWLPSGGRVEIADNAIIFKSHLDGKKHSKVFAVDATQYPKQIDIVTPERKEAVGIYRFDEGRLVVCLSEVGDMLRPTEFSAKSGSHRMLMVLKRTAAPVAGERTASAAPQPTTGDGVAAKVITDAELTKMLPGVWKYRDDAGALVTTLHGNGTWSSIRESEQLRLFQKVFVRTPISSGTWSVKNGTLTFLCTASIYPERVNHALPFTIRSISANDFIFVDYMGRLGKAARVL
jgi:uncharacterized protein (TIGR03067 family)